MDIDFILDIGNDFYTFVYDCKFTPIHDESLDAVVGVETQATMIRATRLSASGEKEWYYGDNKPKWLIDLVDDHIDEIEKSLRGIIEIHCKQLYP
jgi:hypothetical protein